MFAGRRAERIALFVFLPLLLAVCFVTWRLWRHSEQLRQHSQRLNAELDASRQREASLQAQVRDEAGRAALAAAAAQQAERDRREAITEVERSRLKASLAMEAAEYQRRMAEEMRKRRDDELDALHEVLGRIAEAERTPMGVVVNLGEDSFLFDFDKADLRPENREILSRIAGVLLVSYGYRLFVYGHTDDQGAADYNQRLSERRANAVTDYLVEAGLPREIIESKGFGQSSPRMQGTSREARKRNRRVEIGVVDTVVEYRGEVGAAQAPTADER